MIDLHSHILPGLDDGAEDAIAATPNVREDYPTTADAMERGVGKLRAVLEREGVDLELLPGWRGLARTARPPLARRAAPPRARRQSEVPVGRNAVLGLAAALRRDRLAAPLVRHDSGDGTSGTEPAIQADLAEVASLVDAGALIQVTAASLDGRLGSRTRASARKLVDAGLVHMVGSDAHTADIREVGLSGARKAIGDEPLASWLTESVPEAIVRGEPLPPRPTPTRRPGLLARLRGG